MAFSDFAKNWVGLLRFAVSTKNALSATPVPPIPLAIRYMRDSITAQTAVQSHKNRTRE
jgi:hypothetical protein